jgi:hypothetical protein
MTEAVACFALLETHRANAVAKRALQSQQPLTITCALDPSAHPTCWSHAQRSAHQAPPLRSFAESRRSCIAASLRTMFRYRRRLIAAWPSRWSFPLTTRRRSWGSLAPFAGLLPLTGGGSFLIGPGPLACSSSRRAPIDFRRVDSPLHQTEEKHESRQLRGESRAPGLASGL